jgi:acetyltransferase-like isoleucine patch superfamily enzyme
VLITDNDAHPLHVDERHIPGATLLAPVFIEAGVFVGARSIILKGVTLGEGCVVGAGSVVSKNVPPYTIVAGNPAQIIRKLKPRGADAND